MFGKFANALKAIKVLLAIVPLIRPLIAQVEIPGFGADKKAAVLAALSGTIDLLPWEISTEVKETVLKIAGALIDMIIGVLNLLGQNWKGSVES